MWYTLIDKHGSAHRSRIGECRFVYYVRITRHKKKTRHESLKFYFFHFFGCCPYSTLSVCVPFDVGKQTSLCWCATFNPGDDVTAEEEVKEEEEKRIVQYNNTYSIFTDIFKNKKIKEG